MMNLVDDFLNNITMYRLVLYFLIILAVVGLIYSMFGVIAMDPIAYIFSFTFLLFAGFVANWFFAKAFDAPTNSESVWISALILGLIISPPKNIIDVAFIGWAATLTMASKFILAINKKHLFNPVAIAVAITAFAINGNANWWVGNAAMLPVVAIGGFLIVRKIRRWDLVLSFLGAALLTVSVAGILKGANMLTFLQRSIIDSPLIFFSVIMLTEPLTTPPTKYLRMIYGALVGFLFAPQVHFGSFFTTPEIALVIGNIFAYIVSPKYKLILKLKQRLQLTTDTFDFIFTPDEPIRFTPGQYMEFTFDHPKVDDRGNRRYLSLASSPTESDIRLGIKFGNPPSSFKRNLLAMTSNQKIIASQLIGDFTLPKDATKKLVFIAGGIGITPFRSMLKYLIDTGEKRDIVLVYTAKTANEFVYKDVISEAISKLGIKVIYNDSEVHGHLNATIMSQEVSDYKNRTYYVSGSHGVVTSFEQILQDMQIPRSQVVTDYFPGFA